MIVMGALLLSLLAAPAAAPDATQDWQARLQAFAERGSLLSTRLDSAILDDPTMRSEWRRVGFSAGCRSLGEARELVKARHAPVLAGAVAGAIRKVVPRERIERARVLSFSYGGLQGYRSRVEAELERTSGTAVAQAVADMRATYLRHVRLYPASTNPNDNLVTPRPDLAAVLKVKGTWDLDNPAHLGMACAEQLVPASKRPIISTGRRP